MESVFNRDEYAEVPVSAAMLSANFKPLVGDVVFHPHPRGFLGSVELVIDENTDLIQTEFYTMLGNFGCILLRKKLS